jgi:hypothetical protein
MQFRAEADRRFARYRTAPNPGARVIAAEQEPFGRKQKRRRQGAGGVDAIVRLVV